MKRKVFLDTSYAIALSSPRDQFHTTALQIAQTLEDERVRMVTIRAVMLEIGNALSRLRYRLAAGQLLAALESDPMVEIISLSEPMYQRGLALFQQRQDKEWGLTDCSSFLVMEEQGVMAALTADDHFRQAGFHILMRDE